jgi:hypothetical protein
MTRYFNTLLVLLVLTLPGCASYSQHNLAPVEAWPPTAAAETVKPNAYVRFTALHLFNGEQTNGGVDAAGWQKILLDNYSNSQRFQRVTTDKVDSDVYVYATLRNYEQGSQFSAILTGASLFLIPTAFQNTLTLETVYKDRDGKVLGRVEKSETITTWMQLFLVVALPFRQSDDEIIKHLSQSSLEEAVKQKLI